MWNLRRLFQELLTERPSLGTVRRVGLLTTRSKTLGLLLAVQSVLLVGVGAVPDSLPQVTSSLVGVLSIAIALTLGLDARAGDRDRWWEPRWPLWAVGGVLPGVNVGVFVAYCLRRVESVESESPTGRWKRPLVGSVIVAAVVTSLVRAGTLDQLVSLRGLLALVALNAVGFGLVAAYYDTRFVTWKLDGSGHGWLFRGYHWPLLLVVLVPANLVFVLLYHYRRKTLLERARRSKAGFGNLDAPDITPSEESPQDESNE